MPVALLRVDLLLSVAVHLQEVPAFRSVAPHLAQQAVSLLVALLRDRARDSPSVHLPPHQADSVLVVPHPVVALGSVLAARVAPRLDLVVRAQASLSAVAVRPAPRQDSEASEPVGVQHSLLVQDNSNNCLCTS